MRAFTIPVAAALVALASPAFADFTTVDLSAYVNSNVDINPQTFPTGLGSGNQGTGVPFDIATFYSTRDQQNEEGTWNALFDSDGVLTVDVSSLNISGQQSFYALLNNYYGTPGADEYDITVTTNNHSITYQSIGGVDTRDYNNAVYSNTIANTTTPWFDNGIGQRFDVREFTLPSDFAGDIIESLTITQVNGLDTALFSGLTFSNSAAVNFQGVPEPVTLSLFGVGVAGAAAMRRRKKA